jgi:hypothetical protein
MAGVNVTKTLSYHGTLDGTDVDKVEITGQHRKFRIINRSTDEIYFNVAFGSSAPTLPTVAGDNTLVLPGVVGAYEDFTWVSASEIDFQAWLISGSAAAYSVVGLPA